MNDPQERQDSMFARLAAFDELVGDLRDSARLAYLSGDPAADGLTAMVRVMEGIAVAFRTREAERSEILHTLHQEADAIVQNGIAKVEARGTAIVDGLAPRLAALTERTAHASCG